MAEDIDFSDVGFEDAAGVEQLDEAPTPDVEPTPGPTATQPEEPTTPDPEPEEPNPILAYYKEVEGLDLTQKYANDAQALRGLAEAARLVGKRDEDAAIGKQFREHAGDFESYLRQKQAGPPQPSASPPTDEPPTWEQLQLWRQELTDPNTGGLKENADKETLQKYREAQARIQKTLYDLTYRPQEALKPVLSEQEQRAQQVAEATAQQQLAAAQEQQGLQRWAEQNRAVLYNGGDPRNGLSAAGVRLCQLHDHALQMGVQSLPHRLDYATRIWQSEQAQQAQQAQAQAQPVPEHATRKPAVAAPEASQGPDVTKMGFVERCIHEAKQREAASGQMG